MLDDDFSGVFTPAEAQLRKRLLAFRERLVANSEARQSSGFAVVDATLRKLGNLREWPDEGAAPRGPDENASEDGFRVGY